MLWQFYTVACLILGGFFFLAGTLGLLRFPDVYTRLHALTKADNLGLGLIVLGLLPLAGRWSEALKLLLIWGLALFASASAAHLIARAAVLEGRKVWEREP
ncbi:monovalent cation/H(+) antiporter subunit G [Alkalilimnicola sp. S0819]|uniref:monovalent cation/H(+) antiporter subunit G n=1 Tax=Alkalilimnicola sp. S0819 TaxID=2613922 RepID=UPI0012626529|nr:monovalent cation/H(+) antiporter subunit G [Alkalilimnicola sp. S0819]KAB7627481.1 monovalent cation/H(+) antiporter subunit G [Alkalilimnicola sp. S0819]MPQ15633.1 Na+/H+ antiporter subunit G [Alkalilimnicola sp. S0819]